MLRFSKRLLVVNLLGALFYLGCLLQWLWSLLPFLPGIIHFTEAIQAPATTPLKPVAPLGTLPPSPLITALGVVIVIVIISIVIYILIKAPTAIGKTGQKLTTSASRYIVPVVSHRQTLSPKKRRQLTARVVVYLKVALTTLPVAIGACAYFIETDLSYSLTMLIVAVLASATLVTLCLQLLTIKLLKIAPDKAW